MVMDAVQAKSYMNHKWNVLIVDNDRTCLMILEKMLQRCNFKVTKCQQVMEALGMVQEDRTRFDVIITDLFMPDFEGFELLKRIGLELDLPILLISSSDDEDLIKAGLLYGACDYLVKPIRIEYVRHLWKYAFRPQRRGIIKGLERSGSNSDVNIAKSNVKEQIMAANNLTMIPGSASGSSTDGDQGSKNKKSKRKPYNENNNDDAITNNTRKRRRVIWTPQLHEKFVTAVNQFGTTKAVPKKILEVMNVPGLTRENVASHLQKFRQYHKKLELKLVPSKEGCFLESSTPKTYDSLDQLNPHDKHNNNETEAMVSFQPQPIQERELSVFASEAGVYGDRYATPKVQVGEIGYATCLNSNIVPYDEDNTIIHQPLASYSYSAIDYKFHFVEASWSGFSLESNVTKQVTREKMLSVCGQSIGYTDTAHSKGNDGYGIIVDELGYNEAPRYIEPFNQIDYMGRIGS